MVASNDQQRRGVATYSSGKARGQHLECDYRSILVKTRRRTDEGARIRVERGEWKWLMGKDEKEVEIDYEKSTSSESFFRPRKFSFPRPSWKPKEKAPRTAIKAQLLGPLQGVHHPPA